MLTPALSVFLVPPTDEDNEVVSVKDTQGHETSGRRIPGAGAPVHRARLRGQSTQETLARPGPESEQSAASSAPSFTGE